MSVSGRKISFVILLACMLFSGAGCGLNSDRQAEDVGQTAAGAAVQIDGDGVPAAVKHQLEVLTENAAKWRKSGDDTTQIEYMVLDLDHNGRLELIMRDLEPDDDNNGLMECYEVNRSGDGLEHIAINSEVKDSLLEWDEPGTVHYDSEPGEYHYVAGCDFSDEELEELPESLQLEVEDDWKDIIAWTYQNGKFSSEVIAYQDLSESKTPRIYQITEQGEREIGEEEYTARQVGDAVFAKYGRADAGFLYFSFEHSREDMTEKQIYHALERSYQDFVAMQGYPLGKQEMTVSGQKISIPQYTTIQDQKKQKQINQMIFDWAEQTVNQVIDPQTSLAEADISIEYAGADRVSLLLFMTYGEEGQEHLASLYDAVTIDLVQGKILSGEDLLPESRRGEAAEEILYEIELGWEWSRKNVEYGTEEADVEVLAGNLVKHPENWQKAVIYQTCDVIGIIIPTEAGACPYEYYEIDNFWYTYDPYEDGSVIFTKVDWEEFQYSMSDSEYQGLQEYMPVLTGETDLIFEEQDMEDDGEIITERMSLEQCVKEFIIGEGLEELPLSEICVCDLTQDGKPELVLQFGSIGYFMLHKEKDTYYGRVEGRRSLYGLQRDGIYGAGKQDYYYYQMHFEGDVFVDEYLGGYEYESPDAGKEAYTYYIGDQVVEKKEYEKWSKSIVKESEQVCWHRAKRLR